ncbi:MAG: 30S ribosomal protein S20 [Candidatus Poribacteria bacterium]
MPNTKSAKKHMRADERKRRRNVSIKSSVKTAIKQAEQAFRSGDSEQAEAALREALRKLDKANQKGVLKENSTNRKKSRLAKKFNQAMAA